MDKNKMLERITQIGTIEDDVERRSLLTSLSDELSQVFDEKDKLNTEITSLENKLKETGDKLTKAQAENYDYFKRLSTQKTTAEIDASSTGVKDEVKPKRSFDDLFKDEEGGDK